MLPRRIHYSTSWGVEQKLERVVELAQRKAEGVQAEEERGQKGER